MKKTIMRQIKSPDKVPKHFQQQNIQSKITKDILLTFDYEPFLGHRSGSVDKCLIEPTNALISILNRYDAKGIFFVDVIYLLRLQEISDLSQNLEDVKNQLKSLHKAGHYVFPHIHPHWLDALYLEDLKEFDLTNVKNYSIDTLSNGKAEELFSNGIRFLKDIGISYPKWGYRAGGWCIQPFSAYKSIFEKHQIFHEFSVLPGYKNDSASQKFDFTSVITELPYSFSEEAETRDINGKFTEYPISTILLNKKVQFYEKIVRKYLWNIKDKGWGDGFSLYTASLKTNLYEKEMISVDLINMANLKVYKEFIDTNDYMHWISHPKMFTKHGLRVFARFLKYAHKKHRINYDFNLIQLNKNNK